MDVVASVNLPAASPGILAVSSNTITAGWGLVTGATSYTLAASTNSANPPAPVWASSTTVKSSATVAGLYPNTTYYLFADACGPSCSGYTALGSTSTLTLALTGPQIYQVGDTSITVNWQALSGSPSSATAEGYELDLSTASNFTGTLYSSSTTNVALSTLTVTGLTGGATYYLRVGGINWDNVGNYTNLGSTIALAVGCSTITSVANSSWSLTSTWDKTQVPTSCNPVVIGAGTKVWVDISTATASTTTINGDLYFSRSQSSTMTVVGGNVYVQPGGTLDMGTAADPIPSGIISQDIISLGSKAGQYGLIVQNGGNLLVYGAVKTPWTLATGNATAGATTINVNTTGLNWSVGDVVTIDTEAVTLVAPINAGSINFTPGLGQAHYSTFPVVVADLTRNVVVRSSGTDIGGPSDVGNTAYIQNLVANATSFNLTYGDFQYLGNNSDNNWCGNTDCGVTFDQVDAGHSVAGAISSSTFRWGAVGIEVNGTASNIALNNNNVYANQLNGMDLLGNYNTAKSNLVYANGVDGIFAGGNYNVVYSNDFFFNQTNPNFGTFGAGGIECGGTGNLGVSNNIYGQSAGVVCLRQQRWNLYCGQYLPAMEPASIPWTARTEALSAPSAMWDTMPPRYRFRIPVLKLDLIRPLLRRWY